MVDFAMDVHGTLYPDQEVPQSLVDKRASVVEKFKELQAETDPVLRIFTEPEVTKQIQASGYLYFHRILVQPSDKTYLN